MSVVPVGHIENVLHQNIAVSDFRHMTCMSICPGPPVVSRFRPHWDALCEETGVPSPFPSRHLGLPVNRKSIHLLAGVEIYWPSQLCCVVLCQCNVLCSVMARRFVSRCFVLCRVYFIVLHCIVLYCIVLYCILSYFPISSSMFSQSW